MLPLYSSGLEGVGFNLSPGFNIDALMQAISKKINDEELSSLEESSIDKAIEFLAVIKDFCEAKHNVTEPGLSGMEAYSVYVKALNLEEVFEGDLADVKKIVEGQIDILNKLGDVDSEADGFQQMMYIFKNMSNQLRKNSQSFFRKKEVQWRL